MSIYRQKERLLANRKGAVDAPWSSHQGATLSNDRQTAALARTLPFALFMAFIAIEECARIMATYHLITLEPTVLYYLYPFKVMSVAVLLHCYRGEYHELSLRPLTRNWNWAIVSLIGLLTCVLWIHMDWPLTLAGPHQGFDPTLLPSGPVRTVMTLFRVAGAVLVVPLMEELFWRSYLLRYLIDADFASVPLGSFSWPSFICTALLFGLEHHLFWAGVAAGVIYSAILYHTRNLSPCVLAHAVTNLALAAYILLTGKWQLW